MSNDTITTIPQIIKSLIQDSIVKDVKEGGMFSIELDSAQDISAHEQCSLVLRFVKGGEVKELLLTMVKADSTSGEALFQLLSNAFEKHGLQMEQCVGDSFDGAANMNGIHKGLSSRISSMNKSHVHTWCYAHTLNLVVSTVTSVSVHAITLFDMLQTASRYFKESYKQMNVWEDVLKENSKSLKVLRSLGSTRWWSKAKAIEKIFGSSKSSSTNSAGVLADILVALHIISENDGHTFTASRQKDANSLIEFFSKYETLLTAFTFQAIFEVTTPLSNYLQSRGLDLL